MAYTHGTFLIYQSDQIASLRSFDDLFDLLVADNATEGVPEIAKLEQLNAILTGSKNNFFSPVEHSISHSSALFLVAPALRDMFAAADNDRLSEVSSAWADSESWKDTDVNPFDLFGLLHYLNCLCVKARDENKNLYLLLSSDADTLPA